MSSPKPVPIGAAKQGISLCCRAGTCPGPPKPCTCREPSVHRPSARYATIQQAPTALPTTAPSAQPTTAPSGLPTTVSVPASTAGLRYLETTVGSAAGANRFPSPCGPIPTHQVPSAQPTTNPSGLPTTVGYSKEGFNYGCWGGAAVSARSPLLGSLPNARLPGLARPLTTLHHSPQKPPSGQPTNQPSDQPTAAPSVVGMLNQCRQAEGRQ